jgi:hypothetical protein
MTILSMPDGATVDFGDMPPAQIKAMVMQKYPDFKPEAPDTLPDIAKSAVAGVGRGALGVLGAPGDIGALANRGAEALGIPEGARSAVGNAVRGAVFPGIELARRAMGSNASLPTSQQLQSTVEQNITGKFYEPQTTQGKFARTIGEFGVGAALPGGALAKTANVLAPAIASETAGQLTEGTSAEPYARAGAALLGGAGASRLSGVGNVQRAAIPAAEDRIAAVQQAAERGYNSPAIAAVEFRPGVVDALANTTLRQLDRARFNERLVPQTRGILDDLRTPVNGVAHTIEDLQTARQQLSTIAGNFTNPTEQAAASRAIENITNYIGRMPQSHLTRGNAATATETWNNARNNYASARTAERVNQKLINGELQAASSNSGANVGNAQRQKLRTLLTSPKQGRGLTEAEGGLIESTVRGGPVANALRTGGNLLGGGGGLGGLVSAAVGGTTLGPAGIAAPLVGRLMKSAGDALTRRQASNIVDAILRRSPEMANIERRGRQALTDRQRRALITQLSLAPMPAIKQPAN